MTLDLKRRGLNVFLHDKRKEVAKVFIKADEVLPPRNGNVVLGSLVNTDRNVTEIVEPISKEIRLINLNDAYVTLRKGTQLA